MSQYQIYFVKDGAVTTLLCNCSGPEVTVMRKWVGKSNRMVYAHGTGKNTGKKNWYMLSPKEMWKTLDKGQPKVIAMAELIDAVKPTTMKEIRNDLPVDTFFD